MRRLAYALRFHRAAGTASTPGPSVRMTAQIAAGKITASIDPIDGDQALLDTQFRLDEDGTLFFEWGTIDFGSGSELSFSSVGAGTILGPPGDDGFSHGVVLWRITGGKGAFAGAAGAISSNFLVNLDTEELIDYQFHVLELPSPSP
jgi:hypothetical protein